MARSKKITSDLAQLQAAEAELEQALNTWEPEVLAPTDEDIAAYEAQMENEAALDLAHLTPIERIEGVTEVVVDHAAAQADDDGMAQAPEVEAPEVIANLMDLVSKIDPDAAVIRRDETNFAFNERMDFEADQHPGNDSVQTKLKGYAKKIATLQIGALMLAANVNPAFINRTVTEGRRYNIYAIDKLSDLLTGLNTGHFRNAVNLAVLRSMIRFEAAGVTFNGLAALAATSDKVKVEKGMLALLIRHDVSAATGPTQTSSTMNALQTLGAVVNTGSTKFPIWNLTNTPVTARIKELLMPAIA